jgi:hypothetical protein
MQLMKPGNAPWIAVGVVYVLIVRTLITRFPWFGAHSLATTALVGVVGCAGILAWKWAAEERTRKDDPKRR